MPCPRPSVRFTWSVLPLPPAWCGRPAVTGRPSGSTTRSESSTRVTDSSNVAVTCFGAVFSTPPSRGSLPVSVACADAGAALPRRTPVSRATSAISERTTCLPSFTCSRLTRFLRSPAPGSSGCTDAPRTLLTRGNRSSVAGCRGGRARGGGSGRLADRGGHTVRQDVLGLLCGAPVGCGVGEGRSGGYVGEGADGHDDGGDSGEDAARPSPLPLAVQIPPASRRPSVLWVPQITDGVVLATCPGVRTPPPGTPTASPSPLSGGGGPLPLAPVRRVPEARRPGWPARCRREICAIRHPGRSRRCPRRLVFPHLPGAQRPLALISVLGSSTGGPSCRRGILRESGGVARSASRVGPVGPVDGRCTARARIRAGHSCAGAGRPDRRVGPRDAIFA